jgi:glucose/arabinose dehydrogenase
MNKSKFIIISKNAIIKGFIIFALLIVSGLWFFSNPTVISVSGGPEPEDLPETRIKNGQSPPPEEFFLQQGYKLELVTDGLTYPTMVTFGDKGEVYVSEAGYSYGPGTAIPRILQVFDDGTTKEIARFKDGPITSMHHHKGFIYAIGGRAPAKIWRVDRKTGELKTILSGFPVWGHHFTSELVFGPDGKMYFGVGDPSNLGVIGLDDYNTFGWLPIFPEGHGIPCVDLKLIGRNYITDNPFTKDPNDKAVTGVFKEFGQPSRPGEIIKATPPPGCNGAVFRANPDGSELEVFASGFRNVYGMNFSPDGRLFGIDQGMDNSGSRPVADDFDPLWEIKQGQWYGFPDYPSGIPITDPRFDPKEVHPPKFVLAEHPPLAEGPYYRFETHAGSHHFAFSKSEKFGFVGDMFLAQYGSQFLDEPNGHKVVRFDLETKEVSDFYVNKAIGVKGVAPERPTAAHFSHHDGNLYMVDFGELVAKGGVFYPSAGTGALWKISKVQSSSFDVYKQKVAHSLENFKRDPKAIFTLLILSSITLIGYIWIRRRG